MSRRCARYRPELALRRVVRVHRAPWGAAAAQGLCSVTSRLISAARCAFVRVSGWLYARLLPPRKQFLRRPPTSGWRTITGPNLLAPFLLPDHDAKISQNFFETQPS